MEENEINYTPGWLRVLGVVLKYTLIASILLVLGALTWRSCTMSSGQRRADKYLWTEAAVNEYYAGNLKVSLHDLPNPLSTQSTFFASEILYTESIGQFQFTLRCNESSVRRVTEAGLGDSETPFMFVLISDGGECYRNCVYLESRVSVNRFYRIAFDGVKLDGVKRLTMYIYPAAVASDGTVEPVDRMQVYADAVGLGDYDISKKTGGEPPTPPEVVSSSFPEDVQVYAVS